MPDTITWLKPGTTSLHVLDLPQLHTKPSAPDLLEVLELLAIRAPSWEQSGRNDSSNAAKSVLQPQISPEGVPKYLTSIIASPLRWISDDEQKEAIWEEASRRLAERSGRTAMPAMSRRFVIPEEVGNFELLLHEPSLTGDKLGLKTWAASFLMAKRLRIFDIPRPAHGNLHILELGSGTGLVGMAAAAVLGASVILTDLPEIEANLAHNVEQNASTIRDHGGLARTATLDWAKPEAIAVSSISVSTAEVDAQSFDKFPVIVAADAIYSADHPAMLVKTIQQWLAPGPDSRVLIELPRRDGYNTEIEDFQKRLRESGLKAVQEGEEVGYDDWGGDTDEELQEVPCWWSVWTWTNVD